MEFIQMNEAHSQLSQAPSQRSKVDICEGKVYLRYFSREGNYRRSVVINRNFWDSPQQMIDQSEFIFPEVAPIRANTQFSREVIVLPFLLERLFLHGTSN